MGRDRMIVLGLVALGLVLAGLATWGGLGPGGAEAVVVEATPASGPLSIVWAGDTMIGDASQAFVDKWGYDAVFARVKPLLKGDVAIVNGEGPITTIDQPFTPSKDYTYRSDPQTALAFAGAGITVLGLANNHAMDQGPAGLADTMKYAGEAGLATFGAGQDDREAERPLLVKAGNVTVGVVGLAKPYGTHVTAGRNRAGTIPFSQASIDRGYKLARDAGADYVVAFVHWGENYMVVNTEQRQLAATLADAGYDLVIGSGPHVVHPVEVIGKTTVFYSLGNFVFGTPGRFTADLKGYGLVLSTQFTEDGVKALSLTCIKTDNDEIHFQPRPARAAEAATVFASLGVPLSVNGATATLNLDDPAAGQ